MSMEAKASKVSQRSATQQPTKPMSRTASKASVTPSQMSERTRLNMANANKDPLDALSRMTQRQMAERRSGLQDVDEEYLKNVVYAYAGRTKVEAAQRNEVRANMIPAGVPTSRTPQRQQGQEAQGQQKAADAAGAATGNAQDHVAQEKIMSNQPQATQNQDAVQGQQQPPQQAVTPSSPGQARGAGNAAASAANACDPELYTTCPNCRATLYLVRNAGDPSPYGVQQGQQQQQQQGTQQQLQQQQQAAQQQAQIQQQQQAATPVQQ